MNYTFSSDNTSGIRAFGLNTGRVIEISWGNEPVEALTVKILIDGDENPLTLKKFPVNKVFSSNGGEINESDPDYQKELGKQIKELTGTLTHIFKVFVTEEEIKVAIEAGKPTSFAEYCKIIINLLPKDYDKRAVDVFLQYQYNIGDGKEKTYLELPKNMKHGHWICAHIDPVGRWKKDASSGLRYTDDENNVHPFVRKEWFMTSNFANVQNSKFAESSQSTDNPSGVWA